METLTPKHKLTDRIRGNRLTTTFTLMAALTVGIVAGSVLTHGASAKEQTVDSSDARPLSIPAAVSTPNEFSKIAKAVGPAVVVINTEMLPKQSAAPNARMRRRGGQAAPDENGGQGGDPGDMQDFLRRFFGGQGQGQGGDDENGMGGMGSGESRALGSGFIVDPRGYIITNNHVVDNADRVYVKLSTDPDGGPSDLGRPAHVIGTDKETDIAVIKIDAKDPLPTVKLGNSDGAQVGDWVLAIGSPFELSQTVSAGIVSARNRSVTDGGPVGQFQRFIQTDAAINPGNSGGPLVDMAGEVIGMNTAIYTQSRGSEGVGFAMPSNTIVNVYNMLISPTHKVMRGSIGIQFQGALPSAVSRMYGNGVLIGTVTPGAGAAKAGLQPGDVIVSIDGRNIKDGDDLVNDISSRRIGTTVHLGYLRNGKQSTANVEIGDRNKTIAALDGDSDNNNGPASSGPDAPDAGLSKLGMSVDAVPANTVFKLGLHGGVAVTNVRPGSFASEIGLARGAIITAINRKPVENKADYNGIVSALKPGDDVVFEIHTPDGRNSGINIVGGTLQ